MAEEDQFDIDIYGDDGNQDFAQDGQPDTTDQATDADTMTDATQTNTPTNGTAKEDTTMHNENSYNNGNSGQSAHDGTQQIASTGESGGSQVQVPKQAPIQQGTKRKEGADDRPIDPGATSALKLEDLHWWTTEDDIRGWANQAECEDELKDITFNEHKVNGKSKGQVYVEMSSVQAATALKRKIDSFGEGQSHARKTNVVYNPPHINPFKTLPKDVPNRKDYKQDNRAAPGNFGPGKFNNGGFQGRGGFNRGGGGMNNNFQSRNFTPPAVMNQAGGFNNNMPSFGGNNGGMGGNFGGGFNRGGMMGGGMRGGMQNNRGRGGMGGMGGNMMGGMGGNMMGGMGGMNMGMGGMPMGNMGGGMGMGMGGMGTQTTFPFLFQPHNGAGVGRSPQLALARLSSQPHTPPQPQPLLPQRFSPRMIRQQRRAEEGRGRGGVSSGVSYGIFPSSFSSVPTSSLSPVPVPGLLANGSSYTGGGFGGGQGHFNPAFFNGGQQQQQQGGGDSWNPHGNKRPRPE